MDPLIELQKQIKDNAEDVRRFVSDLPSWEEEMKQKEAKVRASQVSVKENSMPPIRNTTKKRDSSDHLGARPTGESAKKRISASDYAAWEKFDVDKACEDIDQTGSDHSSLTEKEKQIHEKRLRDEANVEKEKGNQFVKKEKWDCAIECYSRAIKCFPRDAIFYCNRALCYLKKKDFRAAETDCTSALALDNTYVKALHRRGLARKGLNQLEEAFADLNRASEIEPNNTAIRKDFTEVERARIEVEMVVDFEQKPRPIVPAKKHQKDHALKKQSSDQTLNTSQKDHALKKLSSVPTVWSKIDDSIVIEPINIPPHKRSKVPLQRILIQEIGDVAAATSSKKPDFLIQSSSASSENLKSETVGKVKVTCTDTGKESSSESKLTASNSKCDPTKANSISLSSTTKVLPPAPRNSVQFIAGWRQIDKDCKMCFQYLKQIHGEDFPKIFQDSLDGNLLSQILNVLATEFVPANQPVLNYLQGLAKVKRFRTLALFLSSTDKSNMELLFKHAQNVEKATIETVSFLKKEYEM